MSLYNDLSTVLTPYANKIKQNESDIGDIQDALEHLDVETDKTLSVDGKPADAKKTGDEITAIKADLADVTNHAVKSAEQLISDKRTVDKVPYKYRASASGKSDRAYDVIVGGTVCFNQKADLTHHATDATYGGVSVTANGDGSYTFNGTCTSRASYAVTNVFDAVANHIVFVTGYVKVGTNQGYAGLGGASIDIGNGGVYKVPSDIYKIFRVDILEGDTFSNTVMKPQIFDLTRMFGTTIADHIYALEKTTAGAGVALFRRMFQNEYYPYNAGSLVSVAGLSAKEVVGFNLWDEEWENARFNIATGEKSSGNGLVNKNKIKVFPNTTYYVNCGTSYGNTFILLYYDTDKNFISYEVKYSTQFSLTTPSNARYLNFNLQTRVAVTTYNHDICINISNPLKNGQYEPYHKTVYPLDSSLTLRGVPVLKDGKIEFDGDIYASDGTVTRKYAERAYQSGDESLANAITDGTNTVYKLSAETTETSTPYTSPQVVNPYGTEEYISETICPVGHITEYPDNLRAKIDGLPWDLSMIAPVEVTYTATRNYTVGQLLIVDNTLYKVTRNIANGGTITAGTNVVATTLSEVIASLS